MDLENRLDSYGQPLNRAYNARRIKDRGVDELLGLCKGIVADGEVTENEAKYLLEWLDANKAIATDWPGNILYARIYECLRDGHLDDNEHAELLTLLTQCAGHVPGASTVQVATTLPFDDPQPPLTFASHNFVLTGKFAYGSRIECTTAILERGGAVHPTVRRATHYVVVGTLASRDWVHASYGRKIETALQWRDQGTGLKIIAEDHWAECLA